MMDNYNTSDSGISIDLSAFYDNEQSQWNFNRNFTNIVGDTWWYNTWDGIPAPTCFDDLFTLGEIPTETIFGILHEQHSYNSTGLEEYFETNDEAMDELIGNYSFPDDLSEFTAMLDNYNIPHTKLFERTTSRGYSQGDYVEVFLPISIRESYGLADDVELVEHCQTDIDHLLWDSPMSVRITINDEEYISETFDGQYENYHYPANERNDSNHLVWNEQTFIAEVLSNFHELNQTILRAELEGIVPSELAYSY